RRRANQIKEGTKSSQTQELPNSIQQGDPVFQGRRPSAHCSIPAFTRIGKAPLKMERSSNDNPRFSLRDGRGHRRAT
ncbi:hypothetical protein LINGRAHAP2_LOCUS3774, partial [Linum grandiflorum]